jgi:hypothetical protein
VSARAPHEDWPGRWPRSNAWRDVCQPVGTRDLKHLRAGSRGSGEPNRPDLGVSDQNRAGDPRRRRLAVVEVVGRERGQVEERRPGVEQSADVTLLDSNVHAGLKYIRFMIDEHYAKEPMTPVDKELIAFASHNAGPTTIERLRREAERRGLDRNVWFNHVEVVAADEIGRETVQYVSNIYKYYVAYNLVEQERAAREAAKRSADRVDAAGARRAHARASRDLHDQVQGEERRHSSSHRAVGGRDRDRGAAAPPDRGSGSELPAAGPIQQQLGTFGERRGGDVRNRAARGLAGLDRPSTVIRI